jgi:hypothetical protein
MILVKLYEYPIIGNDTAKLTHLHSLHGEENMNEDASDYSRMGIGNEGNSVRKIYY